MVVSLTRAVTNIFIVFHTIARNSRRQRPTVTFLHHRRCVRARQKMNSHFGPTTTRKKRAQLVHLGDKIVDSKTGTNPLYLQQYCVHHVGDSAFQQLLSQKRFHDLPLHFFALFSGTFQRVSCGEARYRCPPSYR